MCIRIPIKVPRATRTGTQSHNKEHHKEGTSGYTRSYTVHIILAQIDDVQCHTQTHPQFKNGHHWLLGSIVLGGYRQPSTTLQNSTPKRTGQNPERISQQAISWHTRQDFLKIPSLWEAALESERKYASQKSSWNLISLPSILMFRTNIIDNIDLYPCSFSHILISLR